MSTDASRIHRRVRTASTGGSENTRKSKSNAEQSVPVRFQPENPPHEEFKDFYPLHVTKVAPTRTIHPVLYAIIAVLIIIAAAGAGIVILRQQEQKQSTTSSTSSTPTSPAPPSTTAAAPSRYKNAQFGFGFTLPISWQNVKVTDQAPDTTETAKPLGRTVFRLDTTTDVPHGPLLVLRIDTDDSYAAWQQSLSGGTNDSQKLGKVGANTVSVETKAVLPDAAADQPSAELKQAITDIPTVLQSFAAVL